MSTNTAKKSGPVNAAALRKAIQDRLDQRRHQPPYLQLDVADPALQDGFWRVVVTSKRMGKSAGAAAKVIADVEQSIKDTFGVSVILIPGT